MIDQAIGIGHCSPGEDVLRRVLQNRNIPLREVGAELVVTSADTTPAG